MRVNGAMVLLEYRAEAYDEAGKVVESKSTEEGKPIGYFINNEGWPDLVNLAIAGAKVGVKERVEVLPGSDKDPTSSGIRSPKNIVLLEMRQLLKGGSSGQKKEIPKEGDKVLFEGRWGKVLYVKAGRVKIDFNGPFEGRRQVWEITVVRDLTDDVEMTREAIRREWRGKQPTVDLHQGIVRVTSDAETANTPGWREATFRVVGSLRGPGIDRIQFVEEFVKSE